MEEPSPVRFGGYLLLRELGRGGQGTVWLAEDQKLLRKVALKVLDTRPGALAADRLVRFRREAVAAARLDDPHICALLDAGDVDGAPYLAFRYVEGETLAERIARAWDQQADNRSGAPPGQGAPPRHDSTADLGSRQGVQRIVEAFEKLARALHKAHEKGLIHRDVKPGNVMVTSEGEPVLLDFGLARDELAEAHTLTHSGDLLGTPAYMSPEQLTAQRIPLDRRTDVYSLGATMYEALTLHKPYAALTRAELYQKILTGDPSSANSLNRQIPRDLQVVLETAMEKDRNRRYQTALDLAEDLRRVREFEPIRARPIGGLLRLRRWAQRHPAAASGNAGLMVALLVAVAFLFERQATLRGTRALALAAESARASQQDQTLAVLLAREAVRLERTPQTLSQLYAVMAEHRERAVFQHAGFVNSAEFSPAGDLILTASADHTAQVWTLDGARVGEPLRHGRGVRAARFSPNYAQDRTILTASVDGTACLWRPGSPPVVLRHDGPVVDAEFSPDGSLVASASYDGRGRIWYVDGKLRCELSHESAVACVRFAPAGDAVLTAAGSHWDPHDCSDCTARLWTLDGERKGVFAGHRDAIWDCAFAPDGKRIATASWDGSARVWNVETGDWRVLVEHERMARCVSFSADGGCIAIGAGDDTARLLDLDGRPSHTLNSNGLVLGVRFSPDGTHVAAVGYGDGTRVFDRRGRVRLVLRGHAVQPHAVRYSPDGRYLITASEDGTARLWALASADLPVFDNGQGEVFSLVCQTIDTRERVVTAGPDGPVQVWDPANGRCEELRSEHGTTRVAVSHDGELLLTASRERAAEAQLWNWRDRRCLATLRGHSATIMSVAIAEDGFLFTAGRDGTARMWSHRGEQLQIFSHPDGKLLVQSLEVRGDLVLTGASDGVARLWRRDGSLVRAFEPNANRVREVAFAAAGDCLLTASRTGTVRLLDPEGRILQELQGPAMLRSAQFSPTGDRILASGGGGLCCIHDRLGRTLLQVQVGSGLTRAAWLADGRRFATADAAGWVRIWPADPEEMIALVESKRLVFRDFTSDELERYRDLLPRRSRQ